MCSTGRNRDRDIANSRIPSRFRERIPIQKQLPPSFVGGSWKISWTDAKAGRPQGPICSIGRPLCQAELPKSRPGHREFANSIANSRTETHPETTATISCGGGSWKISWPTAKAGRRQGPICSIGHLWGCRAGLGRAGHGNGDGEGKGNEADG